MSWKEDIQKRLEVFMGDGKTFFPLWKNAIKEIEYNIAAFDFPNLEGTLVKRKKQTGRRFRIEFYFTGADHLTTAREFEASAKDERHWHIRHPYYGDIRCQPIKLTFDNSKHNSTLIAGEVIETILGVNPKTLPAPTDEIQVKSDNVNLTSVAVFSDSYTPVTGGDVQLMNDQVNALDRRYSLRILNNEDAAEFKKLVADAKSGIAKATADSTLAMRGIQSVAQFPAKLGISARDRIKYILDEVTRTRNAIFGISNISLNNRRFFEATTTDLLNGAYLASSNAREGDFKTRTEVYSALDQLIAYWNQFILDLDNLQSIDSSREDNFVPNSDNLRALEGLFSFTIGNLETIALSAKKELEIILEDDSNIINLTHRFYGLDELDENIDFFVESNEIGLSEVLQINKGRRIVWYV